MTAIVAVRPTSGLREFLESGEFQALQLRLTRDLVSLGLCQDQDDDADCVQEAVLKVLESEDRLQRGTRLRPWLYTISLNIARDRCRRRLSHPIVRLDFVVTWAEAPRTGGPDLDTDDLTCWMRDWAAHLAPDQRTAVVLYLFEGLSVAQVASILGRPKSSVRLQIADGKARLRHVLRSRPELADRVLPDHPGPGRAPRLG